MAIPQINTNWKNNGSLAQQLANQGYSTDRAKEMSQNYASSPYSDFGNYAKNNNIQAIDNSVLPTDSVFKAFKYNTPYQGDNGLAMLSQKGIGNDRPMTQSEFSAFAETHPEAARQVGAAGVTFNESGQQIAQPTTNDSTIFGLDNKQWNSIGQMGNVGLAAGQLGLGILSYFDNKKTAEKQRKLLDQQYANNKDLINARVAKRDNIRRMFA